MRNILDTFELESGLRICRVKGGVEVYDPRDPETYGFVPEGEIESNEAVEAGPFTLDAEEVIRVFNWLRGA